MSVCPTAHSSGLCGHVMLVVSRIFLTQTPYLWFLLAGEVYKFWKCVINITWQYVSVPGSFILLQSGFWCDWLTGVSGYGPVSMSSPSIRYVAQSKLSSSSAKENVARWNLFKTLTRKATYEMCIFGKFPWLQQKTTKLWLQRSTSFSYKYKKINKVTKCCLKYQLTSLLYPGSLSEVCVWGGPR